jgi:hypothetical protein
MVPPIPRRNNILPRSTLTSTRNAQASQGKSSHSTKRLDSFHSLCTSSSLRSPTKNPSRPFFRPTGQQAQLHPRVILLPSSAAAGEVHGYISKHTYGLAEYPYRLESSACPFHSPVLEFGADVVYTMYSVYMRGAELRLPRFRDYRLGSGAGEHVCGYRAWITEVRLFPHLLPQRTPK